MPDQARTADLLARNRRRLARAEFLKRLKPAGNASLMGDDAYLVTLERYRAAKTAEDTREFRTFDELAAWFAQAASTKLGLTCCVFPAWDSLDFPAAIVSTAGLVGALAGNPRFVSVDGFVAADISAEVWLVVDIEADDSKTEVATAKVLESVR